MFYKPIWFTCLVPKKSLLKQGQNFYCYIKGLDLVPTLKKVNQPRFYQNLMKDYYLIVQKNFWNKKCW